MKTGVNEVWRMGVVSGRLWWSKAPCMASTQKGVLRRHVANAAREKPSISLSFFSEINNLEIEHELACAATCFWTQAVWTGQWEDEMRNTWKKQVWKATSWTRVRESAGTLVCEIKDFGITVLRMGDGRRMSTKDTCPDPDGLERRPVKGKFEITS